MDDLDYGTRGKIGLIYPSAGWVMEQEFFEMAPKGVITLTSRTAIKETTPEGLNKYVIPGTETAAELLMDIPVDMLILGCTSGSFVNGPAFEKEWKEDLEKKFGVPFTTTASSVAAALQALGARKIAMVTPYVPELNERAVSYLEHFGIETVFQTGMGYVHDCDIDAVPLDRVYREAIKADREDADAVALFCTGLRSIPVIELLEKALKKPVISAIQASMWMCLRYFGLQKEVTGYGSLFDCD